MKNRLTEKTQYIQHIMYLDMKKRWRLPIPIMTIEGVE